MTNGLWNAPVLHPLQRQCSNAELFQSELVQQGLAMPAARTRGNVC
jgi:hypothetical protein